MEKITLEAITKAGFEIIENVDDCYKRPIKRKLPYSCVQNSRFEINDRLYDVNMH